MIYPLSTLGASGSPAAVDVLVFLSNVPSHLGKKAPVLTPSEVENTMTPMVSSKETFGCSCVGTIPYLVCDGHCTSLKRGGSESEQR